jgi:hypothetical protein
MLSMPMTRLVRRIVVVEGVLLLLLLMMLLLLLEFYFFALPNLRLNARSENDRNSLGSSCCALPPSFVFCPAAEATVLRFLLLVLLLRRRRIQQGRSTVASLWQLIAHCGAGESRETLASRRR